ncbi:hypothetical protein DPMN_030546 [Dreissena polymorpha]|uniref:Uncharacterized protein n=1 Tax=Dreissena polymorpha TaxID=45954 RepID=A0A9D4RGH1_DREPO|nr:hypothetical protein DPMN_030546 [Dreissena polymorpha]
MQTLAARGAEVETIADKPRVQEAGARALLYRGGVAQHLVNVLWDRVVGDRREIHWQPKDT